MAQPATKNDPMTMMALLALLVLLFADIGGGGQPAPFTTPVPAAVSRLTYAADLSNEPPYPLGDGILVDVWSQMAEAAP